MRSGGEKDPFEKIKERRALSVRVANALAAMGYYPDRDALFDALSFVDSRYHALKNGTADLPLKGSCVYQKRQKGRLVASAQVFYEGPMELPTMQSRMVFVDWRDGKTSRDTTVGVFLEQNERSFLRRAIQPLVTRFHYALGLGES